MFPCHSLDPSEPFCGFEPGAVALTIAGSDPSGGAGLQADLKTFQQMDVFGMSVVTLLTAQNTQGVTAIEVCSKNIVEQQLASIAADIEPCAIKTGALGTTEIMTCVGEFLQQCQVPIVADPVLVSKHGDALAGEESIAVFRDLILPTATIITPNRFETKRLTGVEVTTQDEAKKAIDSFHDLGVNNVLIKAGELEGGSVHYFSEGKVVSEIVLPRLESANTHGSGCVLAAAITARLALNPGALREAVRAGILAAYQAIAAKSSLGRGIHPADVRACDVSK